MSRTVTINGVVYDGELKGPWPEELKRRGRRQGATLVCMPGLSSPGVTIHNDYGYDASYETIEVNLGRLTTAEFEVLNAHYKSSSSGQIVTVVDRQGNTFQCVYRPNTVGLEPGEAEGFPDNFVSVKLLLNVVAKTVDGGSVT